MDPRVAAIRGNKLVGHNTCTMIDECMLDEELVSALNEDGITKPDDAVRWAIDYEQDYLEAGLNTRWGDEDDSQLSDYRSFKKRRKELGY